MDASTPAAPAAAPDVPARWGRGAWAALFVAVWTVLGLVQAAGYVLRGGTKTTSEIVLGSLLDVYSWAVVGLMALAVAQRLPLRRARWRVDVPVHFAIGLGVVAARQYVLVGAFVLLGLPAVWPTGVSFVCLLPMHLPLYGSMLGVGYALRYVRELREGELRVARLASQLSEAQLRMLRLQMQPHFLFNTLNSIVSLTHRDPHAAERMVVSLSEMLRASLAPAGEHEVTLREELAVLEPYLDIESTRFRGRLRIRTHMPPDTLDARLPQLTLQPLVENAIRHGVAPRREPGCVEVRARREQELLRLTVWDDGAGAASYQRPGGIGLDNLRARLRQLYGEGARLAIGRGAQGGTMAEVLIPYRPGPAPAAAIAAAGGGVGVP